MPDHVTKSYPGLIKDLVAEALSDGEVRQLCFDYYYRPVYRELAPAMSTGECIRRLVDWCYQQRAIDALLNHVREINESAYALYAPRLEQIRDEDKYPSIFPDSSPAQLPPCIVHPLPPAPSFVGRQRELETLRQFWIGGNAGVVSLIGLGGAGKTAIVAEFLDRIQTGAEPPPAGLFVWSFYINQDSNAFLEAAYHYFSEGKVTHGSGAGIFYLLIALLGNTDRHLIVLDGLERMQRPQSDISGLFGDLTDPLLSQIVGRMAAGLGHTTCIITSRFPLPRIESWLGKSYLSIDIDQLEREDARLLLRRHQIKGNDQALDDLIEEYGTHALTLDHLGGYLREYHQGDPAFAKTLPQPQVEAIAPQERRLARVLHAYDDALTECEHALLSRLCVFRFGTTAERLHSVFSSRDNSQITGPLADLTIGEFRNLLKYLTRLHLVLLGPNNEYTAHPAIRDHFYKGFTNHGLVHQAIRRHYSSLVAAPGNELPDDEETINLLEELIYHTLQTGNLAEAAEIYSTRLGGFIHLAWNLGQYSRCIRILNEFPRCPDSSGLIWCYRAMGELNAALALIDPDDTWWLGMIGCLRGRLQEVADALSTQRHDPIRTVTEFLTGQIDSTALEKAPIWTGLPISPAECYLYADRVEDAAGYVISFLQKLEQLAQRSTWHDEIARYDLIQAEIERRNGNLKRCEMLLEKAMQWIVQSGSQEHLCLLHLAKARLAVDEAQFNAAGDMIQEGLHIAERCGFGFYHIELLIEQARLDLDTGRVRDAVRSATSALNGILKSTHEAASQSDLEESALLLLGADHPRCRFIWGSVRASSLRERALLLSDGSSSPI